jgi:hypothetical protein
LTDYANRNLAIEPDFYSVAPKGVAVHAERMMTYQSKEKGGDSYELDKANEDVERAARYEGD